MEPTMTDAELSAAFAQLTDPAWIATIPSYREKQHKRYIFAMTPPALRATALDALWRAASDADMLTPQEHSYMELTPARVDALLTALAWK